MKGTRGKKEGSDLDEGHNLTHTYSKNGHSTLIEIGSS